MSDNSTWSPTPTSAVQLERFRPRERVVVDLERVGQAGDPGEQFFAFYEQLSDLQSSFTGALRGLGGGGLTDAQRIEQQMANIKAAALAWNLRLDVGTIRNLATQAVTNEWNNLQILNAIGRTAVGMSSGVADVSQGELGKAVRQMGNSYGVKLSEQTVQSLISGYIQGNETEETLKARFLQQAKAAYPALSERLDRGETFEQITNPYREIAAQLLERDPNSFDFTSQEFLQVTGYNPDGKGERLMSVSDFGAYLRKEQKFGYQYTTQAKEKAYQVANSLAQMFGKA